MQAQDLLLEDRSSGGNKLIMHPLEKDTDFQMVPSQCLIILIALLCFAEVSLTPAHV